MLWQYAVHVQCYFHTKTGCKTGEQEKKEIDVDQEIIHFHLKINRLENTIHAQIHKKLTPKIIFKIVIIFRAIVMNSFRFISIVTILFGEMNFRKSIQVQFQTLKKTIYFRFKSFNPLNKDIPLQLISFSVETSTNPVKGYSLGNKLPVQNKSRHSQPFLSKRN